MRDFKGMKRQRNRGRGSGGSSSGGNNGGGKPQHNANRAFDSNGPDNVKVRGAAQHIFEKYQQLARDAGSAGDRVLAENYLQHAEHYFRVLRAMQPQRPVSEIIGRDQFASGYDIDFEDEGNGDDEPEPEPAAQDGRRDSWQQQGDRPQNGDYRQRDDRPQGDRSQGERSQGDRPQGERSQNQGGDYRPRDDRQQSDFRPRDDRNQGGGDYRPRDDRPRDERPRDERPRDERPRDDRPRDDRPRDERPRDDRPRDDRPRDDRPREDRPSSEFRPREDRYQGDRQNRYPQGDRPQGERPQGDRPARAQNDRQNRQDRETRPDPLSVIEPQATPLTSAPTPAAPVAAYEPRESQGVLRGEDGATSHAPAFLQSRPEPRPEIEDEPVEARRPRRRRAPRTFEAGETAAPAPVEADES